MATVNELVTKFSFVGSLTPLDNFNANLGQSLKILSGFGVAIGGAAVGFTAWVNNITAGIDPMIQLGRETGVSIEKIQALGYAASVSGSSASALESTISNLTKSIGDSARGMGRGSQAFARLGVNVRNVDGSLRSADEVLRDVGRSVRALNIPLAEQRSLLSQMGVDQSLIQMLNQTDAEMDSLIGRAQRLGVITQEQADATASYNDSLTTMRFGLRAVQTQMAVGLAPTLGRLTEGFVGFLEVNRDLIANGLEVVGTLLIETMNAFKRLLPVIALVGAGFLAIKVATLGFGGALALVFSPVVLITGAIVGIMLAVDDLIVAFRGGESVIADFFQSFFGIDIVPILHGIVDAFLWMVGAVKSALVPIGEFFGETLGGLVKIFTGDFLGGINQIAGAFTGLGGYILDQFASLGQTIIGLFTGIGAAIRDSLRAAVANILPDWALRLIGGDSSNNVNIGEQQTIGASQPVFNIPPQQAIEMGAGQSFNSSSNVSQDVEINIQTNDPLRAGEAVEDSLQRQLETAQTQARRRGGR